MLETPRLWLRRFTPLDAAGYAELVGDAEVMRFVGAGQPVDPGQAPELIAGLNRRFDADGIGVLAIERCQDKRFLGRAGFWIWDRRGWSPGRSRAELGEDAEVELGWALVRAAWGKGYATEAAAALRDHALGALGLPRLVSLVHPENERSLRVVERLGAVHERDVVTARWGPARLYVHSGHVPGTVPGTWP